MLYVTTVFLSHYHMFLQKYHYTHSLTTLYLKLQNITHLLCGCFLKAGEKDKCLEKVVKMYLAMNIGPDKLSTFLFRSC